ncbi:DNA polymerase III PolC-type-like [Cloeon dipterum]|uniref:DNA polymerase III PolC-type-like n=1 Tax=Cloeon dipterum TaxID=197152 RepID=UPI00321FCB3F
MKFPPLRKSVKTIPLDDYSSSKLVFFDLETTGLGVDSEEIVQLSAETDSEALNFYVKPRFHGRNKPEHNSTNGLVFCNGNVYKGYSGLNAGEELPAVNQSDALEEFVTFCESFETKVTIVAHNAHFDMGFLRHALLEDAPLLERFANACIGFLDTVSAARKLLPKSAPDGPKNHKLSTLLEHFLGSVQVELHDSAVDVSSLRVIFRDMGKKSDYQPYTFFLSDYLRYKAVYSNAKELDRAFTHYQLTLRPNQFMQLASEFDLQNLVALAKNMSKQEFADEVRSKCDLLLEKTVVSIFVGINSGLPLQ